LTTCGWLRYGTDDKGHAAALIFSLLVLTLILLSIVLGFFVEKEEWLDRIFSWLGSAFMFTAGIAIGGRNQENSGE